MYGKFLILINRLFWRQHFNKEEHTEVMEYEKRHPEKRRVVVVMWTLVGSN